MYMQLILSKQEVVVVAVAMAETGGGQAQRNGTCRWCSVGKGYVNQQLFDPLAAGVIGMVQRTGPEEDCMLHCKLQLELLVKWYLWQRRAWPR
jgi:hypothetical protein